MSVTAYLQIGLATKSPIKVSAVNQLFEKLAGHFIIDTVDCAGCRLPPQPIDCGAECTRRRVQFARPRFENNFNHILIIAIESDLVKKGEEYYDIAHVRMELLKPPDDDGSADYIVGVGRSDPILCPISASELESSKGYTEGKIFGYEITGGEILHRIHGVDPKNWMKALANVDRLDQITQALSVAFTDLVNNINACLKLKKSYKVYPEFPKPGVSFKYFYSLFGNKDAMHDLANIIGSKFTGHEIDIVVPLETRGLVLGAVIADRLSASILPVQKPGKIPGDFLSTSYSKEYGTDTIQISCDLLKNIFTHTGKDSYKFLIVDDVVATGGSIRAVLDLLVMLAQKYNFKYEVMILVLDEIKSLRDTAQEKIGQKYEVLFRDVFIAYCKLESMMPGKLESMTGKNWNKVE